MIKKITLLLLFVVAFSWQGTAQLTEDFEGGMVSLVNAAGNGTDFAVETTLFHGGAQSVKATYANSDTNILEQAVAMDLSGTTNPLLTFWHIAKTEGTYDKCYVEISTDGGTTYTALIAGDYLGSASDYATRGYFHEDSYSDWGTGSTPAADNTWWKKEEFSLIAYIGATVKIRFKLVADTSTTREGWYIDDVTVTNPAYVTPSATYTAINDCANSQFTVDVDVTNLGGAASVTVADDQGNSSSVGTTGVVSFGPYTAGTIVAFTVTNDDDNAYTTGGNASDTCPPANDACADATEVATLPYSNFVDATGATNNDGFITACSTNGMNDGIWYTFIVGDSGTITITADPTTSWDPQLDIYTGSCGAFTCVDSKDTGGSGIAETYDLIAIAGTQYWVNIGYFSSSTDLPEGPVDVSITTADGATLGTQEVQSIAGFAYYPNPVNNQLSLRANNAIDQVEVLNILGQTVLTATPSATSTAIDMTALNQGTYFVRVQAGDAIQTVKVIKN